MKVYYLDDESHLCFIFKEFLSNEQTDVRTYTEAQPFIEACASDKPDLVFIDYRLRETSGDRVAKQLEPTILKILVTGELDIPESDVFTVIIPKPYKLKDLKELVESYNKNDLDVSS